MLDLIESKFTITKENLKRLVAEHYRDEQELRERLRQLGWELLYDPNGNVIGIEQVSTMPIYSALFMLAPYVKSGSYIAFMDETHAIFRYYYEDGEMYVQKGSICFNEVQYVVSDILE
ncbi:MAG: hypothetical protein DSY80_07725 [Desulfocapsa sp.]|nr:MAG: hypothetical protein DSY80_07725 [Desulfocapsa sp.]